MDHNEAVTRIAESLEKAVHSSQAETHLDTVAGWDSLGVLSPLAGIAVEPSEVMARRTVDDIRADLQTSREACR